MGTVTWMVIAISSPEPGQRPKVWVAARVAKTAEEAWPQE